MKTNPDEVRKLLTFGCLIQALLPIIDTEGSPAHEPKLADQLAKMADSFIEMTESTNSQDSYLYVENQIWHEFRKMHGEISGENAFQLKLILFKQCVKTLRQMNKSARMVFAPQLKYMQDKSTQPINSKYLPFTLLLQDALNKVRVDFRQ